MGEKKKNNKQDRNKKSKQILPQSYFLKMLKFDPFLGFPNFQNQFFLSFLVSHQKNFFSELQNNFCFLKKNFSPISQIHGKLERSLGGGVKNSHYSLPPKKWNIRFRQDCRKTLKKKIVKKKMEKKKTCKKKKTFCAKNLPNVLKNRVWEKKQKKP